MSDLIEIVNPVVAGFKHILGLEMMGLKCLAGFVLVFIIGQKLWYAHQTAKLQKYMKYQ